MSDNPYYKPTGFRPGRPRKGEPPRPMRRKYPGQRGRPPKVPPPVVSDEEIRRMMEWNTKAKIEQAAVRNPNRRGRPIGFRPGLAEDTSPPRIRKLRAAFCNHFLRTGELDEAMMAQLGAYAKQVRGEKVDNRRFNRVGTSDAKTSATDQSTDAPAFSGPSTGRPG